MNAWTVTSPNGRTVTEPLTAAFVRVLLQEGWVLTAVRSGERPPVPAIVLEWQAEQAALDAL